jgi:hypothetical protein
MSNDGVNLPEIDIDLSGDDVKAFGGGGGPILPIGTYTFDITAAEEGSSKKNQPVAKITFKVADEGEQNGVELSKSYSLQQKALGRIKNLMIAAGCRLDKIRLGELVGARIIADIVHTQGEGGVDAQGNVTEGRTFCDIVKEQAVASEEPPPPPPPAKNTAPATNKGAAKNGTAARRA